MADNWPMFLLPTSCLNIAMLIHFRTAWLLFNFINIY